MPHFQELQIIHWIHQFRSPLLDMFFKFLNFFDTIEAFLLFIPIIWMSKGWKTGLKLFYIVLISFCVNQTLKEFFLSPRPFHLDASLKVIHISGFGFPSAAAQTTALMSGLLLSFWRSQKKWAFIASYFILISFSRIYLGVHFPTDILGGWVVGFFLWAFFMYGIIPLEKKLKTRNPTSLFLLSQFIPLLVLINYPSPKIIAPCFGAMGIGVGLLLGHIYQWNLDSTHNTKETIRKAIIGTTGTIISYAITHLLSFPPFIQFFLTGLFLGGGSSLSCRIPFFQTKSSKL
jgi:undecaprenyl-diphosphatase